jgi:hypothetical protein
MYTQKNVTHLRIGANVALTTAAIPATLRQIGFKNVGELLCDTTAFAGGEVFQVLYKKADGSVIETPSLSIDNLLKAEVKATQALAPQISHIGFNGTDGDIVETNSGNYLVSLGLKDIGKMIGNKRLYKFGEFVSPTVAVKSDIAVALAGSLALNQSKDAWVRVIAKAICSTVVVAANSFDGATAVVQGSKWINVTGGSTYNTGTQVVVGDFVRLGTVSGGTAVTSGVYKVVEVSGADDVKLDRNVTEATGTYATATTDIEVIPAAVATLGASKWGVVLTGNDANAPYDLGKFGANLVYFSVGVSTDFQTTPVRLTQTPFIGDGTYKQIADMDWFLQANGKEKYRIAEYPVNFTPNIVSTETPAYVYTFTFKDDSTDVIGGRAESLIELIFVSLGGTLTSALDAKFVNYL